MYSATFLHWLKVREKMTQGTCMPRRRLKQQLGFSPHTATQHLFPQIHTHTHPHIHKQPDAIVELKATPAVIITTSVMPVRNRRTPRRQEDNSPLQVPMKSLLPPFSASSPSPSPPSPSFETFINKSC